MATRTPARFTATRPRFTAVRLSEVEYAALVAECEATGLSASDVLRLALRAYSQQKVIRKAVAPVRSARRA